MAGDVGGLRRLLVVALAGVVGGGLVVLLVVVVVVVALLLVGGGLVALLGVVERLVVVVVVVILVDVEVVCVVVVVDVVVLCFGGRGRLFGGNRVEGDFSVVVGGVITASNNVGNFGFVVVVFSSSASESSSKVSLLGKYVCSNLFGGAVVVSLSFSPPTLIVSMTTGLGSPGKTTRSSPCEAVGFLRRWSVFSTFGGAAIGGTSNSGSGIPVAKGGFRLVLVTLMR